MYITTTYDITAQRYRRATSVLRYHHIERSATILYVAIIRFGPTLHSYKYGYASAIFSARQHAERAICYRLSVCPSVTRVDQSKTVERIIEILSPSDRTNILVFRHQRSLRKSDGFTPNGGAKYKG